MVFVPFFYDIIGYFAIGANVQTFDFEREGIGRQCGREDYGIWINT